MQQPKPSTSRPGDAVQASLRALLAALLGLAVLTGAGTSQAQAAALTPALSSLAAIGAQPSATETRVGTSHPQSISVIGLGQCIAAGQHPDPSTSQPQIAVGNCVAAEGGGFGARLRSISWADDTGSITLPGRSEPKLIYEANPKHGPVSRPGPRGEISRAPRGDCQAMLECSTQIGPRLREGVEPDSGLPVIFRQHREFEGTEWWHGYVPGG